jgi:hypothetical protein
MPVATASVETTTPGRYAKQLASHLGRRAAVIERADGIEITIDAGACLMTVRDDALELRASAADGPALDVVKDVIGRHLERFGQRNELHVDWHDE